MKVVVDDKIPYIKGVIEKIADNVVYAPGTEFTPELVKDADALIIRTRTHCNEHLLKGSRIRFIATATIGFDHIGTAYCHKNNIEWRNAPGCNAGAVTQYLQSTLILLQQLRRKRAEEMTLGVVGVGNVGSKVAGMARQMGFRVLLNDPPREKHEGKELFSPLQELVKQCDILTFHVPLNHEGEYKTHHLADEDFFKTLAHQPVIINTSRGEVIDTRALLTALNAGLVSEAVIDVWEHEPDINLPLLNKVFIGTPHIAGYSADGKANATRMALDALCSFFNLRKDYVITPPEPVNPVISADSMDIALLKTYDPRKDSQALKQHPESFEKLRGNYPLRREKEAYTINLKG